ncbi:MAG: ABC transporter ATP-binding protein, partial [Nitrospina sp.]|nr:ABC transporter ATP-binding protein [Nitrospina sp.]
TLLSSSEPLQDSPFLKNLFDWLQPESQVHFVILLLVGVVFLYVAKNIYLFILMYLQTRFSFSKHYQIKSRLFRSYMHSPYWFHLKHNSAELLRNLNLAGNVISMVLAPVMVCVTEVMMTLAIFGLLVWVDPASAIVITLGQGILVGGYFFMVRRKLTALGEINKRCEGKTIQQVHQGLGSIKEVKILGQEDFFDKSYSSYLWGLTNSLRSELVIGNSVRFIVETITVVLVLGVMIALLQFGEYPSSVLTTFSLFAVAAVRLMPTINRFTVNLVQIRFGIPSLNEIYSHLKDCEKYVTDVGERKSAERMVFEHQVELVDVSFQYEDAPNLSLDSILLSIPKNSTVGLVGASGAGKTTVVDVIIGLLKPAKGKIMVDGKDIHESLFSWQRQIGYIPQSIYLADDTVKNNVAFGLPIESIDEDKVWKALELAQLDEFVRSAKDGLSTMVGENGVRLSGGQRQRIGIARALYYEPQILVMDEATAALDNETERVFMESVEKLGQKKTIIIIAHRLTTVKNCDTIFLLDQGRLIASGSYETLMSKSSEFRQMACV